ncbi:MAG: UDP-N-acetylmuramoyl-L-alanine--D-glutamate ligase [Pseudomonadota bacterium]
MSGLAAIDATTRLALWGFGREGRATRSFLADRWPSLTPTVVVDGPAADVDGLPCLSGDVGRKALVDGAFDVVVKSPGISLYRPEAQAALDAGTLLTSSTNLWLEAHPGRFVLAVTGTKGKSTTASLIAHLWAGIEPDVVLAGNVGRPLIATPPGAAPIVLELSSYQCADLQFAPGVAVLTNLFPEHLDWHGSRERYFADKLRLVDRAPLAVLNAGDARTVELLDGWPRARWYQTCDGWLATGPALYRDHERVFEAAGWRLPGDHNLINLAAALEALDAIGVPAATLLPRARSFTGLAHRLQVVGERGGLTWVDDSISTTPESAAAALQAFPGRAVTLLLGGQDRGQDMAPLAAAIADRDARVVTLPDNGPSLGAQLARAVIGIEVIDAVDLADAVERAAELTPPGGVVLLSPAAPSYGRFTDFEERGRRFAELAGLRPEADASVTPPAC